MAARKKARPLPKGYSGRRPKKPYGAGISWDPHYLQHTFREDGPFEIEFHRPFAPGPTGLVFRRAHLRHYAYLTIPQRLKLIDDLRASIAADRALNKKLQLDDLGHPLSEADGLTHQPEGDHHGQSSGEPTGSEREAAQGGGAAELQRLPP